MRTPTMRSPGLRSEMLMPASPQRLTFGPYHALATGKLPGEGHRGATSPDRFSGVSDVASQDAIVLGVRSNPEPDDGFAVAYSQRAIGEPDPRGVDRP